MAPHSWLLSFPFKLSFLPEWIRKEHRGPLTVFQVFIPEDPLQHFILFMNELSEKQVAHNTCRDHDPGIHDQPDARQQ